MSDNNAKRAIDSLEVYANTIKLGTLEFIEFKKDSSEAFNGSKLKPKGYYKFTYDAPDSLHPSFQLSINGMYPVRSQPYYFLDQAFFEEKMDEIDALGRSQVTFIDGANDSLPQDSSKQRDHLYEKGRRYMMLPSVFYNAIPQGLLYESIVRSPDYKDIDFDRNILAILSVTGSSPIGRIHCIEKGRSLMENDLEEVDVSSVHRFLMQYYDPNKPKQINVGALVNVMRYFSKQSGVPGQMPKIIAAVNAKSLEYAVDNSVTANESHYSHYSEYIKAYNNKVAEEGLKNTNYDLQNDRMTGVNAVCILKTEKSAAPGVVINEYICMSGLALSGSPAVTQISGGGKVLLSVRFDYLHELGKTGFNRGFEDMASIMGRSVTNKGMGFPVQIDTINRENPLTGEPEMKSLSKTTVTMLDVYHAMEKVVSPENFNNSRDQLFYSFVYSNFVRNSDNHLRNYGVLYEENSVYLSPAYDIFNTDIYINTPGHGTLAGVRNETETKTHSLKWLDATEIMKLGQAMTISRHSIKNVMNTVKKDLEVIVKQFIEHEAIEQKIFTDESNSAILVAMTRSFEDSIKTIMNRPEYTLKPGPLLTSKYNSYLDSLKGMADDRLADEYDEILMRFKPAYLSEIVDLVVDRQLIPGKNFWGQSTGMIAQLDSEAFKSMKEHQMNALEFNAQQAKMQQQDAEFEALMNPSPVNQKGQAKPGFDIPDDSWDPALLEDDFKSFTLLEKTLPLIDIDDHEVKELQPSVLPLK